MAAGGSNGAGVNGSNGHHGGQGLLGGRTAEELRRLFDQAFAAPPALQGRAEGQGLILIQVAGVRHALRVSELVAIAKGRPVTPVPSRAPGLLGLTGFRGSVVPVYGLAALLRLGQRVGGTPAADEVPGWLAVARAGGELVALAFETLDRYAAISAESFRTLGGGDRHGGGAAVRQAVTWEGETALVIELAALLSSLRQGIAQQGGRDR
jgi:chemotaxis signal transduction protein